MRKNVRKTALLTAAVFACFAGQPACAQEPEAYQLDTVVVTAHDRNGHRWIRRPT